MQTYISDLVVAVQMKRKLARFPFYKTKEQNDRGDVQVPPIQTYQNVPEGGEWN